jgi:dinuclear metal center YbgI/SA1388 family protein
VTIAPNVAAVLEHLAPAAPPGKAAGWDPVGLQLGDPGASVHRVGVCHEVTAPVVDAARDASIDLLISYHPLLFRPVGRITAGSGPAGRAYSLVRAGVAVAVVHTAFDVAPGGTADALADALNLADQSGFGPAWPSDSVRIVTFVPAGDADAVAAAMADAGAGRIGNYTHCSFRGPGTGVFFPGAGTDPAVGTPGRLETAPEVRLEMVAPRSHEAAVVAALVAAHPYEEPAYDVYERRGDAGMIGRIGSLERAEALEGLAARVGKILGGVVRWAGEGTAPVQRVAVVPGSGGDLIGAASGADVLVTGDVKHHAARAALETGMAVIDPGHAATERPGMARLYAAVRAVVEDAVDLTKLDADPWRAIP